MSRLLKLSSRKANKFLSKRYVPAVSLYEREIRNLTNATMKISANIIRRRARALCTMSVRTYINCVYPTSRSQFFYFRYLLSMHLLRVVCRESTITSINRASAEQAAKIFEGLA